MDRKVGRIDGMGDDKVTSEVELGALRDDNGLKDTMEVDLTGIELLDCGWKEEEGIDREAGGIDGMGDDKEVELGALRDDNGLEDTIRRVDPTGIELLDCGWKAEEGIDRDAGEKGDTEVAIEVELGDVSDEDDTFASI
jgi:hypothetical protein